MPDAAPGTTVVRITRPYRRLAPGLGELAQVRRLASAETDRCSVQPLSDRDAEYVPILLSGVEQIPRHVLEDDVPWDRDSFGEYTTSMVRHGIAERVLSVPGGP